MLNSLELNSDSFSKISVIVPIYNGQKDLPDLIDCLYGQTYPSDRVEYLLVDNDSTDNTAALIQKAVVEAASKKITLHYLAENKIQSSYAARNMGILVSQGEILVFTDADCRPQPDWLYQLVQPFTNQNIGIVGGAIESLPGETLFEQYAEHEKILSQERHLANPYLPFIATANLAVRRQSLQDVGLFRPHLTTGGDADLCWRIQQNSHWQLHYAPKAIVLHRHRTSLKGLLMQHHRYGRAVQYLNELYDVETSPATKWNTLNYLRGWKHWLFVELRPIISKMLSREESFLDLLITPIAILTQQSFAMGRMGAKLPEEARYVQKFQ